MTEAPTPDLEERFLEPEGWQWGHFTAQDFDIRYGWVGPAEPDAIVIALPGLSEFCEKYFETARDIVTKHNMAFWVLDWPGQGHSERILKGNNKRHSMGYELERDILHNLIRQKVQSHYPAGTKLAMLAHSMGGHIGLRYLHRYPDMFSCAAFSAPLFGLLATKGYPGPLAHLITGIGSAVMGSHYAPGQGLWSAELRDLDINRIFSHDPVRQAVHNQWCEADERLRVDGVTWTWLKETVKSCALIQSSGFLQDIKTPCFIGSAGLDQLVDNDAIKHVKTHLKKSAGMHFDGAFHEILMETDEVRQSFLGTALTFVKSNI